MHFLDFILFCFKFSFKQSEPAALATHQHSDKVLFKTLNLLPPNVIPWHIGDQLAWLSKVCSTIPTANPSPTS